MPSSWEPQCSVDTLRERASFLGQIRKFFAELGVLEVQTSCIGRYTVTDPHTQSIEVPGFGYLQTSPEYQLKRLLTAGAPSVYQMGPAFRADEIGRLHANEFTILEWYRLNYDHRQLMEEVSKLVDILLGPSSYRYISYPEVIESSTEAGDDLDLKFLSGLRTLGEGRLFVTDYPEEQSALARLEGDPPVASRFELIINGIEIANGYHELGDPADLEKRFLRDLATRREFSLDEPDLDPFFMDAMKAGMPSCAGVALGVDRLLMIHLKLGSIAEVSPFSLGLPSTY
tara:strand:+ start:1239 stop:2096 length:858 start_codon:yes stop_codon:yes gene_type:complete